MSQAPKKCYQLFDKDEVIDKILECIDDKDVSSFKDILSQHKEHVANHIEKVLIEVIKNRRKDFFDVLNENDLLSRMNSVNNLNPLYELIASGDVDWVKLLFQHQLYVNNLESPVFFLLKLRQIWNNISAYKQILNILLKHGLGNNEICDGNSPVFYAAKQGMWHYVEILLKNNVNIDTFCNGKTTRQLITNFKPELLKHAAKQELNPKFQLFELLLLKKENKFISTLIKYPEFSNSEDDTGFTLLQLAIQQRLKQAVYSLLHYGANPNTCNIDNGKSVKLRYLPPVLMSLLTGQNEIFIVLIYHQNIDLHTQYSGNNTIYHVIAKEWKYLNKKKIKNSVIELVDVLFNACFESGVNILEQNTSGNSAISIACKSGDKRLIHLYFKYGGFSALNEKDLKNINPQLLNEFFDDCIKPHLTEEGVIDYIEIDYGFIDAAIKSKVKSYKKNTAYNLIEQETSYDSTCTVSLKLAPEKPFIQNRANLEMNLLKELSNSKSHISLLRHPVIKTFLFLKWKKIFPIYLINFIIYLLFTISVSFYVHDYQELNLKLLNSSNNSRFNNEEMKIFEEISSLEWLFTAVFTIVIALRELSQFQFSKTCYIKSMENYLELSLIASVTYLLLFGPQRELASITVLAAYFELTLLIGRYPAISLYITIFIQVVVKSIGLLCIFFPLIFAFAFGFDLIFHDHNNPRTLSTLGVSIFKSFMMADGEIEPEKYNLDVSGFLSRILFILFFIFIVISFSNVLNALAISDTQAIIHRAKTLICIQEVVLYSKLERFWLSFSTRKKGIVDFICNSCIRYNVNACPIKFTNRSSNFKLETSVNAVPYFTRNIHRYLFGYDRDEIIKQLIEILELDKDEYSILKDDTKYLYAGSDYSSKSVGTKINTEPYELLTFDEGRSDSCIYKDIRFLFNEYKNLEYYGKYLDKKQDESENRTQVPDNVDEYEFCGGNETMIKTDKFVKPNRLLPELSDTAAIDCDYYMPKQEVEYLIEYKSKEIKNQIQSMSSEFNSRFETISHDLKELTLTLRSIQQNM